MTDPIYLMVVQSGVENRFYESKIANTCEDVLTLELPIPTFQTLKKEAFRKHRGKGKN